MKIKRTDNETDLWFAQKTYLDSFPESERRETGEWVRLAQTEPAFHCNVVEHEGENVGILTFWEFADFTYVEHFAMSLHLRGKGMGGQALDLFLTQSRKPVVLEVELPCGEIERRRISFYERHGLELCHKPYTQPPYCSGGECLSMLIMQRGFDNMEEAFPTVVRTLYERVYKAKDCPA